jgi:hypothetical protein
MIRNLGVADTASIEAATAGFKTEYECEIKLQVRNSLIR